MTKRMIIPLIFGLAGCAILISLGVWQVQRLAWKEGILAEIAQEIAADPVPLPASFQPDEDRYLPVSLKGSYPGDEIHVLFSIKNVGPGYRVIAPFETSDGRRILVDRGFAFISEKNIDRAAEGVSLVGNLHWPDETDSFTGKPRADGRVRQAEWCGAGPGIYANS